MARKKQSFKNIEKKKLEKNNEAYVHTHSESKSGKNSNIYTL